MRRCARRFDATSEALAPFRKRIADLLCQIKEEGSALSVGAVIEKAKATGSLGDDIQLAPATVHRLLSRHGLMDRKISEPTNKDRRRFAFEKAGPLWMNDVMHGPAVLADGRKRHAYLIGSLDDATRVVPQAAFALSENTPPFSR